ncbi:MAG: restriction endonuclease subunit S [Aequorivita sp.]
MTFLKDIILKPITGEWGTDGEIVKVLRTTNFTNAGVIDFSKITYRDISRKKIDQKKLLKGDIIIEKSGGSPKQPVGRVVFFDEDGVYLCNNFTSILRPKKDKVVPKYLHYLLYASHRFGVTSLFQNKTTGIINLQLPRYIDKLQIPLPPLKTQIQIADILDNAASLRDKTEQLLKEYDLLAQSIFLEMFGDPVKNPKDFKTESLSNYGSFKNGLNFSKSESGFKVKYLGVGDFKSKYKLEKMNKLSFINLSSLPSEDYFLKDGDLVFVRSNGNRQLVGRCIAIFPKDKRVTFSGFCIRYRLNNNNLNSIYLTHLFRNNSFKNVMLEGGRGANIQNINQQILGSLKIPIPKPTLQNQFVEKIALIEQQKELAKQELKESEDLFNCLLQKAFKGELV